MTYSWSGKRLDWKKRLQPSGSAAATQEPVRAATDLGMALSFFSTMSEAFPKKYLTLTTIGHMARHPHHYWRRGPQFRVAIRAPRKALAQWHTPMHSQQHRVLSM